MTWYILYGYRLDVCSVAATAARLARFSVVEPPMGHLMFYGTDDFYGAIFVGFLIKAFSMGG